MTNLETRINLNLSSHCIETAIRRRYNRCLSMLLKAGSADTNRNRMLEGEIDLLKAAMETFDFSYLRSTWPELAGYGQSVVTLAWTGCRQIGIRVNGHFVDCSKA